MVAANVLQQSSMKPAGFWIQHLNLLPHPEGGYYREVYRSEHPLQPYALPAGIDTIRSLATSIYFLLEGTQVSKLHRIKSDETWHFYAGGSLTVFVIDEAGKVEEIRLGGEPEKGEVFQATVPAGSWFGAAVNQPQSYSLVGCTVAPGFDFRDFEMGNRKSLLKLYPKHRALIEKLTRA